MSQNDNGHHSGSNSPGGTTEPYHHDENAHDAQDNSALENAIGDAFKQFGFINMEHKEEETDEPRQEPEQFEHHDDDFNLEESVSQAFASIGQEAPREEEPKEDKQEPVNESPREEEQEHQEVKNEEVNEELNLEDVIGDAFKSIAEDLGDPGEQQQTEETHAHGGADEQASPPHTTEQPEQQPEEVPQEPQHEEEEDTNLEDAIGAAFQSLVDEREPPREEQEPQRKASDHELRAALSSLSDPDRRDSVNEAKDHNIDLAGLVSNVVQQMAGEGDSENVESAIPKDVLQELAAEITHQVQGSEDHNRKVEVPLIDENVLMHFQNEAEKEEDKQQDSAISNALANAVRTAIRNAPQKGTDDAPETEEQDLENLQMNEIFQNAFNMAMQNPQELLTSFEGEPELALPPEVKEAAASAKDLTVSTAAAIAALSVKDALNKKDTQPTEDVTARKKSLSIAETLAFHRSSMSSKKPATDKPDEAEKSLPQAPNPHLSNILSSLSQHIQSGSQSQNLMLLIRQMTNALMLNKNSVHTSALVQETTSSLKESPDVHRFHVENLKYAKDFLTRGDIEAPQKGTTIIDNVMEVLLAKDNQPVIISTVQVAKPEPNDLLDFHSSVFNTLTSFGSLRGKNAVLGVKPDTESDEYKERIRIDNRERKKKWREGNIERNKDNDLRSRVIKRANVMFGEENTSEKKAWIEEEFHVRREKRLAKQKKENGKSSENQSFTEELLEKSSKNPSALAHDSVFIKRLTTSFNLVTEIGAREDPKSIMTAASAYLAVVASSYAVAMGCTDGKTVTNAITLILNSILDSTVKTGDFSRLSFLLKADEASTISQPTDTKDILSRISALTGGSSSIKGASALELLRSSQKRLGLDFINSDNKKVKLGESSNKYLEKDKSSMSRIQSEIDQLRSSISSATSGSYLNAGLKMPSYRSTVSAVKEEVPGPLPKGPLPFISNKVGTLAEGTSVGGHSALRKPGSFQRPAFSKPQNRGKNLGFPPLYSASFELK